MLEPPYSCSVHTLILNNMIAIITRVINIVEIEIVIVLA